MGLIVYLAVVILLTGALYTALMRDLRPEPVPETALTLDPARTAAGIALLLKMTQRPVPIDVRDRYIPTEVHQYARLAREHPAGVITTRAARLAQAAIPHLDRNWADDTGSFRAICGVAA